MGVTLLCHRCKAGNPATWAAKEVGCSQILFAVRLETGCFAFIEAHLRRHRLSHPIPRPGHAGAAVADAPALRDPAGAPA